MVQLCLFVMFLGLRLKVHGLAERLLYGLVLVLRGEKAVHFPLHFINKNNKT